MYQVRLGHTSRCHKCRGAITELGENIRENLTTVGENIRENLKTVGENIRENPTTIGRENLARTRDDFATARKYPTTVKVSGFRGGCGRHAQEGKECRESEEVQVKDKEERLIPQTSFFRRCGWT